jgi:hypothetical protein
VPRGTGTHVAAEGGLESERMTRTTEHTYTRLLANGEGVAVPVLPLTLNQELAIDRLPYNRWSSIVAERALPHTAGFEWSTEHDLARLRAEALATSRTEKVESVLVDLGDALLFVACAHGRVGARAAAHTLEALERAEAWLRVLVPEVEPAEDRRVRIEFWTEGKTGPYSVPRTIEVPSWADIAANYPREVRGEVAALVDESWRPAGAGRLLLWYGPPGTGKTHALRALVWHWRSWCSAHYITDPESFFGSSEYMLDVLTAGEDDDDEDEHSPRWRLLVLEDTGELLTSDAKARTGQGLSRFLNVVDGLIGQGLRVVVLVTTNEPLGSIHPAAARPGRCAARVEFPAFPVAEAREWLEAHGHFAVPGGRETLADLYGRLSGVVVKQRAPIGFSVS